LQLAPVSVILELATIGVPLIIVILDLQAN